MTNFKKSNDYGKLNNLSVKSTTTQPTAVSNKNQRQYQKYARKLAKGKLDFAKDRIKIREFNSRANPRQ